jgi:hypothetical protein
MDEAIAVLFDSIFGGLHYNSGMQSGNTSYVMWALTMYHMFAPFQLGMPLASIETNLLKSI